MDHDSSGNKVCLPCDTSCLTCSGPSNNECTSCATGEILINGVCEEGCPEGYYMNVDDC